MSRLGWLGALGLLAASAVVAGAAPAGTRRSSDDYRVIVRLADAFSASFAEQVERLGRLPGVTQAKPLHRLGMAVVRCDSEDDQESLLDTLDADEAVELAVPDSWISILGGSSGAAPAPKGGSAAVRAKALGSEDRAQCSANPACAARGLSGLCCPAPDGAVLSCCSMHDESTTVELHTFHGTYITARPGEGPRAHATETDDSTKFQLVNNDDGTVSFRTSFGTYLTAKESGWLGADAATIDDWEKFTLVFNDNATMSLKTFWDSYVTAEQSGYVLANRMEISTWEQFHINKVQGAHQHMPNDPALTKLWGMNSWNSHDIDAPEAWKTWTGGEGAGIVVGVIDTGIDYNHEDLKEQMWVNPNEIPGNGIDDDENGVVDDVHGADFANEDGDPWDDQLHGTHCSGTIAGIGNNGIGVAGVAWRGVRLMALKFLTSSGGGRTSDAIRAIDYAVAHGAKVLSNSWGGGGSSSALRVAIERAEAAGILFLAAAGNDGTDNDQEPQFPANYKLGNMISVASTTHMGVLSDFSCYGNTTVHVAAPGSQIYSTAPKNKYKYLSGTSMATPHVSGLAALVWMYRPHLSMTQLREIIFDSVEKYSTLEGKIITGGLINAKDALETAWAFQPPRPPAHASPGIEFEDTDPAVGAYSGSVTIQAAVDESDVEYYRVYFVSGAGFQLEPLGEKIAATGESELVLALNGSFAPPHYAVALVVVTGRAEGEMPATLGGVAPSAPLVDYGVPTHGPRSATWGGDIDLQEGRIEGTVYIGRAKAEADVSHYNVYWRNASGARGALLGVLPGIGFAEPTCSGNACGLISLGQEAGVYTFERGAYGDEEVATYTASGPGKAKVTRVDTEDYYDTLTIAGEQFSGDMSSDLPLEVEFGPGVAEFKWESDASINANGWAFTMQQQGSIAAFRVNATAFLADGLEVVSAYGPNEYESGSLFVELSDYDDTMPPSSAFTPASVQFEDMNPGEGWIAGTVRVRPAEAAIENGGVLFYQVDLADSEGKAVTGHSWSVSANGSAEVTVDIPATAVPEGAVEITARPGNNVGVAAAYASTTLADIVPYEPGNVTWSGDSDGRAGTVMGDLMIEPAESELGMKAYVVHWYDGTKGEEVGRQRPIGNGLPTMVKLGYGTRAQASAVLVVSEYAWGEMEGGVVVPIEDSDVYRRRMAEAPPAAPRVAKRPRAPEPQAGAEPWIARPAGTTEVVWVQGLDEVLASAPAPGSIRSAVTLPGVDAQAFVQPEVRAAFAASVAERLPRSGAGADVRVVRVLALSRAAAARTALGAPALAEDVHLAIHGQGAAAKVEFEVAAGAASAAGRAGDADRVEARLILLSHGGRAAARFDFGLAGALAAAGVKLPSTGAAVRFRVAEPKQVDTAPIGSSAAVAAAGAGAAASVAQGLAAEATAEAAAVPAGAAEETVAKVAAGAVAKHAKDAAGGGRRVAGVEVDTTAEETAADEQAGAALVAAALVGSVALAAVAVAVAGAVRRHARGRTRVHGVAEQPLQGVHVEGKGADAE